jgi:hypothetical protein
MTEVFTPKEYAKWLVNELTLSSNAQDGSWMCEDLAKQCALISIKEIMMSTRILVNHYIKSNGVKAYMDIELSKNLTLAYYREVKQEIQAL